ncbi:LysR family transcriptional regulator [Haliangium sp.]|uniref:LysR family transcriptional regulator n=1 Tax=Haliangium sp. TaxID=2663208 RepID=UPI003D10037E
MHLNEIAVFARVVEHQGFSAAARQLGVPKSTVSRAVRRLEQRLGVRLLQRSTRTLALTDAGAAYHARVTQAMDLLAAAEAEVTQQQEAPTGVVRITAPYDFGVDVLPALVAGFVARYPELHVYTEVTGRVVDLIAEGFDLALRAGRMSDSALVARKIGAVEGRLFAAPAYLAARGTPTAVAELAGHDCVLFRPRDRGTRWHLHGPAGPESVDVTGPVGADEFSFVRAAVRLGAGIGMFPGFMGAADVAAGRLVRVLPEYERRGSKLYLVYPSTEHLPRRVTLFRDYLIDAVAALPWA